MSHPAGRTSDLADGEMKEVVIDGRHILLARVGDRFYACDARCPHLGGELARGKLEGTVVTCPRHGSQFDLTDGHVVRWLRGGGLLSRVGAALKPPRPVRAYDVKVADGELVVELE